MCHCLYVRCCLTQDEDSAKRKADLEAAVKAEPTKQEATPQEMAEWEKAFKDF